MDTIIEPEVSLRPAPRPAPQPPHSNSKKMPSPNKAKNESTFQFHNCYVNKDVESSAPVMGVFAADYDMAGQLSQARHQNLRKPVSPPRTAATYPSAEQNSSPLTTAHFQLSPDSHASAQVRHRPYPHFSAHDQVSDGFNGADYHMRSGYAGHGQNTQGDGSRYQPGSANIRPDRPSSLNGAGDSAKKNTSANKTPPSAVRTSKSQGTSGKKTLQSPSGVPVASVTLSLQRHHK